MASTYLYRRILQVYLFFEQGKDGAFTDSCPVKKKQLLVMNYQRRGTTKFPNFSYFFVSSEISSLFRTLVNNNFQNREILSTSLLSESIAFKMITIVIINASLTVA